MRVREVERERAREIEREREREREREKERERVVLYGSGCRSERRYCRDRINIFLNDM